MLILILGDCHGHLTLLHRHCLRAQEQYGVEAAIQVGDFGFYPKTLNKFLHEGPRRFPIPVHAIDGNHEDHAWLISASQNGSCAAWTAANLTVHERGSLLEIGGIRIGFLGGALHADRRQEWSGQWTPTANERTSGDKRIPENPTWANWVTAGNVSKAITSFSTMPPDLIVTHSCPAGIGVGMVGAKPLLDDVERFVVRAGHYCGPFNDCGEGGLTALWHRLERKPANWVFGHFHRIHDRMVDGTRFVCVGSSDGTDGARFPRTVLFDTHSQHIIVDPEART